MTMTAIFITIIASLAAGLLIIPFVRRIRTDEDRMAQELAGYRSRLIDLETDVRDGRINPTQAQEIKSEIRKKVLLLAKERHQRLENWQPDWQMALIFASLVILGSGAVYWQLGSPDLPDRPLAARIEEELIRRAQTGDPNARITLLSKKLSRENGSFEDYWTLASLLRNAQRYGEAVEAYKNAANLQKDNWPVQIAYAETMVRANNGEVDAEAKSLFAKIVKNYPNDFRGHYYTGLAEAQTENYPKALDIWLKLLQQTSEKAPWLHRLRVSIAEIAQAQNLDPLKVLPKPHADVYKSSPDYQLAQLKTRVEADEKDVDAWLGLADMYGKYGNAHQAFSSLARLKELFPDDRDIQSKADALKDKYDLKPPHNDLTASKSPETLPHDSADSEALNQMVSGLAEKLQDNPDNLSGWQMLIRSYLQLGQKGQAKTAFLAARENFSKNSRALTALSNTARDLGINID
jgi:cytochrome c-type biogenesis protein CcmH